MLIPFGILSSAASLTPVSGGPFSLLETQILDTSAISITFASLDVYASSFKHLQIRYQAKNSSTNSQINLTMNDVTTASYSRQQLTGDGTTASALTNASQTSIPMIGSMATSQFANLFASGIIDIVDAFSTDKNKVLQAHYGSSESPKGVFVITGLLSSISPVGSVTLTAAVNNFAANSRFSIYGIKE